ncbi:hypothetical protein [Amycolatopsis samaneae]|uniref:Uncharacterized protein n=1 Tax=Amycolatopsis samaneae TaxID=664691 RepID=A0ABW5GKB3_9PSEU
MDGHVAFENQLARWQRDHPDAAGLAEFVEQIGQLCPSYQRMLDLAAQQRANTIEALMGKSDLHLGLDALLGGPLSADRPDGGTRLGQLIYGPPRRPHHRAAADQLQRPTCPWP